MTATALIFICWAIVLGTRHLWFPAAILIAFAVFGLWLGTLYGRSDRWGR